MPTTYILDGVRVSESIDINGDNSGVFSNLQDVTATIVLADNATHWSYVIQDTDDTFPEVGITSPEPISAEISGLDIASAVASFDFDIEFGQIDWGSGNVSYALTVQQTPETPPGSGFLYLFPVAGDALPTFATAGELNDFLANDVSSLGEASGAFAPNQSIPLADVDWASVANAAPLTLLGTTGNDVVTGTTDDEVIDGLDGDDLIRGRDGDDTLTGGIGIDTVQGEAGDDLFIVRPGDGGPLGGRRGIDPIDEMVERVDQPGFGNFFGDDTVRFEGVDYADVAIWGEINGIFVGVDDGTGTILQTYLNGFSSADFWDVIETLEFADQSFTGDDAMIWAGLDTGQITEGTNRDDHLVGNGGDDTLLGGNGDDTINGGTGADNMKGGAGDDLYLIGAADGGLAAFSIDVIEETPDGGDDTIRFTDLDDGALRIVQTSQDGIPYLAFIAETAGDPKDATYVFYDPVSDRDFWDYIEEIQLADGTVMTKATGLRAFGTDAGDLMSGTGAGDLLDGGLGNDEIRGFDGDDSMTGGGGTDDLSGGRGADTLLGGEDNDFLRGNVGEDSLAGGAGDDQLRGQKNGDVLDGGTGDDNLKGGGGNDTLLGGDGRDFLNGGTRRDLIEGGAGDDRLIGRSFDDTLIGGAGDDRLNGGGENDRLDGGAGRDVLKGGAGADVFVFDADFGTDRVLDFDITEDRLEISAALAAGRDADQLAALSQAANNGVELDFGDGNVIRLLGLADDTGLAGQIDIV